MPKKEKILFENTNIPVEAEIADNYKSIKFVNTNIPVPCDTSIKYRKKLKFKTTNRTVKIADMCPSNYAEDSRIFMQDSKLRIYGTTIKFVARFKDNIVPEHDLNSFRIAMIQTEYNLADAHDFVIGGYVRGTVNANNGCEPDEDEQGYYVGVNLGSIPASKLGTIMSGRICYTYQGKTYYCPLADVPTPPVYTVTLTIQNGTVVGPEVCYKHQEFDITVVADDGYGLPDTVTVLGCTSTYDKITGVIHCSNPVGNVSVNVVCEDYTYIPLHFTAEKANSTVKLTVNGTSTPWTGSYSTDGQNWTSYVSDTTITLANIGDKVYFKGDITGNFNGSKYLKFAVTGQIAAGGNCNSIYVSEGFENLTTLTYNYCFYQLFSRCSVLTKAPKLPATTLSENCYRNMFSYCSKLIKAPGLPATTLADHCYSEMFSNCTSLTKAPELPATTLVDSCYNSMFSSCSSLTKAPELPATTLAESCYNGMFAQCTSLTEVPELPATTLAESCYTQMFLACIALTEAPELSATTLADMCCWQMFAGCAKLNYIKIDYTGNFGDEFSNWVLAASSTGDFYYNGTDTTRGTGAIPTGWTIHTF